MKFDDAVCVLLSEKAHRKSSGAAETSRSDQSVKREGSSMNREKKKNNKFKSKFERSKSKSRGVGCWQCDEKGHFQRDCKQKKDGGSKGKKKDSTYVTGNNEFDALILSLAVVNQGLLIRVPLFMTLPITKSFKLL